MLLYSFLAILEIKLGGNFRVPLGKLPPSFGNFKLPPSFGRLIPELAVGEKDFFEEDRTQIELIKQMNAD